MDNQNEELKRKIREAQWQLGFRAGMARTHRANRESGVNVELDPVLQSHLGLTPPGEEKPKDEKKSSA